MDEPNREPQARDNTGGNDSIVPPIQAHPAYHPEYPINPSENQNPGEQQGWYVPKRRRRKGKAYCRQFCRAGADRHIELIVAMTVLVFVVLQYFMTRSNNKSTSDQVGKIITAANGINTAAESFSESADHINTGVGDAIDALQGQVIQVQRSAKAAEDAVRATQDQTQLDQRAWVGLTAVRSSGENTPGTAGERDVWFPVLRNSGKTPATDVRVIVGTGVSETKDLDALTQSGDWMQKLIDAADSKALPEFGTIIRETQDPRIFGGFVYDPSYFPPSSTIHSLNIPEVIAIGVLPPDLPRDVGRGEKFLAGPKLGMVIFGEVKYHDIWRKDQRLTKFCYIAKSIPSSDFVACPVFNDMN